MIKKSASTLHKVLIGVSLFAIVAGAGAAAYVDHLFYRAEPNYEGREKLMGLVSPVDVYRDNYGIPHIFAANMNDAARALGYVHAGERLFQMEMQRRAGQGRLAEMFGADMLDVDKFTRTLGLYRLAQSSLSALSPEAQAYFQAYADGVNAWLVSHKNALPPEFLLLHSQPEPWQSADSLVWGKLMGVELSHNYHMEILRARLATKIPPEQLSWLFPMPPKNSPVTTNPGTPPEDDEEDESMRDDGGLGRLLGLDHAASNEWVIGGTRTETGKPMLANDPHLGLQAPILWYLARIVTPQGSVKGATVPGLPIVMLGQNDHLAWGMTTTGSDTQDLFVETIDPANANHYLSPEGSAAFVSHDEIIHVKNGSDVLLKVRTTRHGPVLSDINAELAQRTGIGKVVALAFTGLGDKDTTAEALLRMNQAKNADEFLEALKLYQTPTQNIVYADNAGAFGFISPGLVPVRKKGDGLMPVDGASGDNDWDGFVSFSRLPQLANPDVGYIFNANNAVVGADSADYFGRDWEEPYRAMRLQQFFSSIDKFSLDQSVAMQADHLSLVADDFLPLLMSLTPADARAQQALELLRKWDGVMDKDKPEPALFDAWLYEFHQNMLVKKTGDALKEKGPFAAASLSELVAYHAQDWCGDNDCHAMIAQSFDDALALMTSRQGTDMSKWRWGRENVSVLRHKFYSHIPLMKKFTDLSVESSGDFYTLDRGGSFETSPTQPFARTHGGGFRGVYDLANPEASLFMIATGESGHVFSDHYGDLVQLWNNVHAITLTGSAEQLSLGGAEKLVLEP